MVDEQSVGFQKLTGAPRTLCFADSGITPPHNTAPLIQMQPPASMKKLHYTNNNSNKTVENTFSFQIEKRNQQIIKEAFKPGTTLEQIGEKYGLQKSVVSKIVANYLRSDAVVEIELEWWKQYYIMLVKDPKLAFQMLTRVMVKIQEKQAKLEVNLTQNNIENVNAVSFRWMTEDEWNNKLLSNTVPIPGKNNFMKTRQDSKFCSVEGDGEKLKVDV